MTHDHAHAAAELRPRATEQPAPSTEAPPEAVVNQIVDQRDRTALPPSRSTVAARIVAVLFGAAQVLLVLRIMLEDLGAVRGNEIVAAVLNATQPLVDPFEGMFRATTLARVSILDTAAITALVSLTLLEVLLLGIIRIPRRGEDI